MKGSPFVKKIPTTKILNPHYIIIALMDGQIETTKSKAKKVVEKTATTTYKATVTMVKVIFILIIIYTLVMSLYIFLVTENKDKFLTDVATISVGGFWAFFLGYFGWRMGQTIEIYLHNIRKKK